MKKLKINIKKAALLTCMSALAFTAYSCTNDMTELNVDPKHPTSMPSENLMATGMYQGAYNIYSGSVAGNNYRFFIQQWTETTYTDETNYNLVTRNQPQLFFNRMYSNTLYSYKTAVESLQKEGEVDADIKNNKFATIEIASILIWEHLVDTFGNIPYTQALQPTTIKSPVYDDARTIYNDLIARLDKASAMITTSKAGYGAADLIYAGNMAKWKKFANSLKLRLAINLADVDPAAAKAAAESAINSGVLGSDADSYKFTFTGGAFSNPLYDDLVASKRNDFLPADGMVNSMNSASDPRREKYFTLFNGIYKGGQYGTLNTYANYSHINPSWYTTDGSAKLFSYTEVLFLKAEAAARGFNAGGTAQNLYNSAVQSSMTENGVASADATAYIAANPYNAASWKQSIGYQSYVALWNNPFAAWNFVRRLDYPVLITPPASMVGGVPVRMPYSANEYVVNQANVTTAATAIGGDKATTKLFWDKN